MTRSGSFIEFEERFVILERQYISLLYMARQEKVSLTLLAGRDNLLKIKNGLNELMDELLDSLKPSEREIACNSAKLIIAAIDNELNNEAN